MSQDIIILLVVPIDLVYHIVTPDVLIIFKVIRNILWNIFFTIIWVLQNTIFEKINVLGTLHSVHYYRR